MEGKRRLGHVNAGLRGQADRELGRRRLRLDGRCLDDRHVDDGNVDFGRLDDCGLYDCGLCDCGLDDCDLGDCGLDGRRLDGRRLRHGHRRRGFDGRLGRRDHDGDVLCRRWGNSDGHRIGHRGRRGLRDGRRFRHGLRHGLQNGLEDDEGRRQRHRRGPRGKEDEWVEVAVGVGRCPNAEMHVRGRGDRIDALANDADDRSLGDDAAAQDGHRGELKQRDGVSVSGLNRDRAAAAGNKPGERDGAAGGSDDGRAERGAEVDAAVLAAGVGIGREGERSENRSVDRPGPSTRGRSGDERRQRNRGGEQPPHGIPPSLSWRATEPHANGVAQRVFNDSA
ncbi:MAG: hypothetical protein M3R12_01075 [Actinomycetota bacterium]|nr:hypothetical protein [Actinomycetota bacterium]